MRRWMAFYALCSSHHNVRKKKEKDFQFRFEGNPELAQCTLRPYCHGVDSHSSHHPRLAQLPRPALHPRRCRLRTRFVTITPKLSNASFNFRGTTKDRDPPC